jgi:hypothetical protein
VGLLYSEIGRTACLSIGFYTEHRHCTEKYDTYPDVNVYIHMEGWALGQGIPLYK